MNKLDFSKLANALTSLERAIEVYQRGGFADDFEKNTIRAGVIQNFEFTYELSWKYMRKFLMANYSLTDTDLVSRKQLFKMAGEFGLINSTGEWLAFHEARNKGSHMYDEEIADDVFASALNFPPVAGDLLKKLTATA